MVRAFYTSIAKEHDLFLVAVAGLICLFTCYTALRLFSHATEAVDARRVKRLVVTAGVFGAGVWAAHFVVELAYRSDMPVQYAIGPTAASLIVAITIAFVGMTVAASYDAPATGGAIIGASVSAMYYVGIAAVRGPAHFAWNSTLVAASIAVSVGLSSLALRLACREVSIAARAVGTMLLMGGICGLHLVAMASVSFVPDPAQAPPSKVFDPQLLAVVIAAVTGLIIASGLSGSIAMDRIARRAVVEAERLRTSQAHLARAQRIARLGSIHIDLLRGRIEWSDETYRILSLSRDAPPTIETFVSLVHPDDAALFKEFVRKIKAGTPNTIAEFRIIRPDGSECVVHDETEVIRDDFGHPALQITTIRDITDERAAAARQRKLEKQLQHSQRLKALGTLAGGIAHELNNKLVPIVAITKMMLDDMPADDANRIDMEMVLEASDHARNLVQQIIAFSRRHEVMEKPIDFAAVTRDALALMRATIPATIQIADKIDDVPPMVGDAAQLQQVIVNLMTNAAQAIGEKTGQIAVRLSLDGESQVRLSIADTGCGMDEATVERVFEPFFTTRSVGAGTGLGLSVAQGIVASHAGRIDARSSLGKGSEFVVRLPVRSASADAELANLSVA